MQKNPQNYKIEGFLMFSFFEAFLTVFQKSL